MDKYSFSSKASFFAQICYSAGPAGEYFEGTLGITPSGRLEFILKNGKTLFSAPLSQIHTRVIKLSKIIGVKINSEPYRIGRLQSADQASTDSPYRQWEQALERYKAMPADNEPIITTKVPSASMGTLQMLAVGIVSWTIAIWGTLTLIRLAQSDIVVGLFFLVAFGLPITLWYVARSRFLRRMVLGT